MKLYINESTHKNSDGDELIVVTVHESMIKKLSYVVFVEK